MLAVAKDNGSKRFLSLSLVVDILDDVVVNVVVCVVQSAVLLTDSISVVKNTAG